MKIHKTKNYVRYRIMNPKLFIKSSFRTHNIGRSKHSLRVAGKLKKTGEWSTQALLIHKDDYKLGLRLKKIKGKYKLTPKLTSM